jgi:membrane-bound lytic murein transglycosylase B
MDTMALALRTTITFLLCSAAGVTLASASKFDACLDRIRAEAIEQGIDQTTAVELLADVSPDPRVIELDRQQPEFTSTLGGYLESRLTPARLEQGQRLLARHERLLERITKKYGVPGHYLIAFWGLETNYGSYTGRMSTVRSLATLACDRRRGDFFARELLAALQLVDQHVLNPDQLQGSWAGALGNFQFLPSVYRDYAVDADGDGRPDLWSSFEDAAESAAAFLNARGWQAEQSWGLEVQLPEGFDLSLVELTQPMPQWQAAGIRQANQAPLPDSHLAAELILPAGLRGPAFLVHANFNVIMRWNPSRFYALSVGLLADQIMGGPSLFTSPPDDQPLRIEQVRSVQRELNRQGHNAGNVDGRIGPGTRNALRSFQAATGLPADGYPDPQTLTALGIDLNASE